MLVGDGRDDGNREAGCRASLEQTAGQLLSRGIQYHLYVLEMVRRGLGEAEGHGVAQSEVSNG